MLKQFFQTIQQTFALAQVSHPPLVGKYYTRTGSCTLCGKCCENIYLIHGENTIQTVQEFEQLQPLNPEYAFFTPMEATEHGMTFQCSYLQEDKTCGVYNQRPLFCKRYPTEDTLLKGGFIPPECGYEFRLHQTFAGVLDATAQKTTQKRA